MSKPLMSVKLPVLDISKPVTPSCMSLLAEGCKEWGFFHIKNHGISKDLYQRLYKLSKDVFKLPLDVKLKLGPLSSIKTYTPHFIASPFFESLKVSGPSFLSSAQSSTDILFHQQKNSEYSLILQEYGNIMTSLSRKVIGVLLLILGNDFDSKYYETEFKNCHGYLRIINYSPPKTIEKKDVEGLGMHTDMSCITIVYQDDVGGLQVKSRQEGQWMDINPCEGTLVVNIGDMLQAWSNEHFRSSEHRVVLKRPVNRLSLAFFWCFEDEKLIRAPEEVVGEEDKRLYKPFICSEYLKFRESNEKGKFEKVGLTVKGFAGNNNVCM